MDNSRLPQLLWFMSVMEYNNFLSLLIYQNVFQARSFETMFTIINIIIICKFHARVCPWLEDDTVLFCAFTNPNGGRYSVVHDRSPCSGSWVHIVLWRSFSLYHSVAGFLIAASKALRWSFFGEALATWQNKCNLFRGLMSPEKNTNLESHLLVQLQFLLKFSTFFKTLQSCTWEICISNNKKNNLDLKKNFIVSNLVLYILEIVTLILGYCI